MSDSDLRRITFVTGAYPRMRAAALSVAIGPSVIWLLRSVRQDDEWGMLIGFAAVFVSSLPLRHAGCWFDRRFGRVVRPWDRKFPWWPFVYGASFPLVVAFDDRALSFGGPSPIFLALAAFGLWLTIRDWPYRPQLLVFFATCLVSALALGHVSHQSDFLAWRMRADAAAVLAWMVVGCLDFLTLRRVLVAPGAMRQRSGI